MIRITFHIIFYQRVLLIIYWTHIEQLFQSHSVDFSLYDDCLESGIWRVENDVARSVVRFNRSIAWNGFYIGGYKILLFVDF